MTLSIYSTRYLLSNDTVTSLGDTAGKKRQKIPFTMNFHSKIDVHFVDHFRSLLLGHFPGSVGVEGERVLHVGGGERY